MRNSLPLNVLTFHMKNILFALTLLSTRFVSAQYWQQAVDYTIEVDLDHETAQYKGNQTVIYTNNSPETLHKVFFHQYFNAFKPGSEMAIRLKNAGDKNGRFKVDIDSLSPKQQGYLKVSGLTQDGVMVEVVNSETILEVTLAQALAPGASTTFKMSFEGQVPDVIRRAGKNSKEGIAFRWHNGILKWRNTTMRGGMRILTRAESFTVCGEILM